MALQSNSLMHMLYYFIAQCLLASFVPVLFIVYGFLDVQALLPQLGHCFKRFDTNMAFLHFTIVMLRGGLELKSIGISP